MRTSFLSEIAFPILVICSRVGASTEFSISESGVQCNGPFQVNALTLDCGGGYCTFGSDVNVEATVTITSALGTDTPTVKVTVANVAQILKKEVNICNQLSSSSGATCPNAGSYSLDSFRFTIPGSGDQWYAQNGYWGRGLALTVAFDFGNSNNGYCSTKITLKKNSGYQMAMGAFVVVGLATIITGVHRRRKVATLQLHDHETATSHFEMMPNEATCRV